MKPKTYLRRTKKLTIKHKRTLREKYYFSKHKIKFIPFKFKITKELVKYFIEECKEQQEQKKRERQNYITQEEFFNINKKKK